MRSRARDQEGQGIHGLVGLLMVAQDPGNVPVPGVDPWSCSPSPASALLPSFFVYYVTYPWDLFIIFPYRVVLCI